MVIPGADQIQGAKRVGATGSEAALCGDDAGDGELVVCGWRKNCGAVNSLETVAVCHGLNGVWSDLGMKGRQIAAPFGKLQGSCRIHRNVAHLST